ncbi:RNB-like domain containing protein, putative [Babesia bigemina]|uniref:Ribosomal RNA-processing protein 44 n=1 Tax=Babesia bigemina TaxID=5866 RepID=A0A061D9M5_BABBI|nr:RNB-like domain containing protein, putative [Babesia bigemina]CDR95624.1 RNB-like domain containing protein, putative [Babesia bigemina]|eukprot:XP_012767810.1 RNB-like domain containing protein, putative [Babesia bigemina]
MEAVEEYEVLQPSLKRTLRTFWRASGHRHVKRFTREVYHRADIGCGVDSCTSCVRSQIQGELDGSRPLLVLTVDVVMKQITFCERCLDNCVIPATVLNEVRRRSLSMYARMKKLLLPGNPAAAAANGGGVADVELTDDAGADVRRFYLFSNENFEPTYVEEDDEETAAERDQRLIEKCATWYQSHLPGCRVILLGNHDDPASPTESQDAVSLEPTLSAPSNTSDGTGMDISPRGPSAVDIGQAAFERLTVEQWARELQAEIADALEYVAAARPDCASGGATADDDGCYPAHLSEAEMQAGIETGRYYSGILNMFTGSFQNGYVKCGKDEFKVSGTANLNRAIHGDNVCVEVIVGEHANASASSSTAAAAAAEADAPEELVGEESEGATLLDATKDEKPAECIKQECRVVGILRRNWREYCGTLLPVDEAAEVTGTHHAVQRVFVPVDARIPFIFIDTRKSGELDGKRIVVAIDSWDRFSRKPCGHWVEVLGDVEDMEVESAVILREHDVITRDFPSPAYKELPPANWTASADEIARRMDFRNQLVFSVDPPQCKDIDDALGYRVLANGHVEVSVHIADVTHFVRPDSWLDREAAQRCTTVYLVDRRTDMLPSLLTTNLCSLVEDQDRLCFSVVWEFDQRNEICATRFGKGIIRSRRAFSYKDAQALIDAGGSDEITQALQGLNRLAKLLRSKRFERGAVELESPDVKFEYELTDIRKMEKYILYDTNRMVEEFMLLANVSVATKIFERFPTCALLRRHPPPMEVRLKALQRSLSQHRLEFEFGNSRDLNASLKRIVEKSDSRLGSALRIMTTRCMSQAVYCSSGDSGADDLRHYGLCTDLYTHFTSPIRRYADVVVHRMLAAALDLEAMDTSFFQELPAQCEALNRRHRNANWCGRESTKLFAYLFLKKQGSVATVATVVGATEKRLSLLAHEFGIEATASVDVSAFDPETQRVTLTSGRHVNLFDHVKITLNSSNKHFRYNITAELL